MSTGLDCRFYEKTAGNWYYDLEQYSRREEYDTYAPFPTFQKAHDHLQDHHANPGGYSIDALRGCKHDLLEKLEHEPGFSFCNRCGDRIDTRTDDAKRKQLWEEACARNGDTLIIYALMGDGKHLTAEQTLTLSALVCALITVLFCISGHRHMRSPKSRSLPPAGLLPVPRPM